MTWVRLDDSVPLHPKLLDAGAEAAWLWVAGIAHANRHTTDGRVSKRHLEALYPPLGKRAHRLATTLVELGLWVREGANHYRIHDYEHYQEEALSEHVAERKRQARERKRRERERKKRQNQAENGECHGVTGRDIPAGQGRDIPQARSADESTPLSQPPVPSRPVPSRPESESARDTEARKSTARTAIRVGYAKRFEQQTGDPWNHSPHGGHIEEIASWFARKYSADAIEAAAERWLDALFASERFARNRWPLKWAAEDPGQFLGTAAKVANPDADLDEQIQRLTDRINNADGDERERLKSERQKLKQERKQRQQQRGAA